MLLARRAPSDCCCRKPEELSPRIPSPSRVNSQTLQGRGRAPSARNASSERLLHLLHVKFNCSCIIARVLWPLASRRFLGSLHASLVPGAGTAGLCCWEGGAGCPTLHPSPRHLCRLLLPPSSPSSLRARSHRALLFAFPPLSPAED